VPTKTERDPRKTPAFLDVIKGGSGRTRTVEFVTAFGTVVYSTSKSRKELECTVETWRRWAKEGEVMRVGSPTGGNLCARSITTHLTQELSREVNLWRNNLTQGSASDEEIVGALIELGLDHLRKHDRRGVRLMKCLDSYRKRGRGVDPLG